MEWTRGRTIEGDGVKGLGGGGGGGGKMVTKTWVGRGTTVTPGGVATAGGWKPART